MSSEREAMTQYAALADEYLGQFHSSLLVSNGSPLKSPTSEEAQAAETDAAQREGGEVREEGEFARDELEPSPLAAAVAAADAAAAEEKQHHLPNGGGGSLGGRGNGVAETSEGGGMLIDGRSTSGRLVHRVVDYETNDSAVYGELRDRLRGNRSTLEDMMIRSQNRLGQSGSGRVAEYSNGGMQDQNGGMDGLSDLSHGHPALPPSPAAAAAAAAAAATAAAAAASEAAVVAAVRAQVAAGEGEEPTRIPTPSPVVLSMRENEQLEQDQQDALSRQHGGRQPHSPVRQGQINTRHHTTPPLSPSRTATVAGRRTTGTGTGAGGGDVTTPPAPNYSSPPPSRQQMKQLLQQQSGHQGASGGGRTRSPGVLRLSTSKRTSERLESQRRQQEEQEQRQQQQQQRQQGGGRLQTPQSSVMDRFGGMSISDGSPLPGRAPLLPKEVIEAKIVEAARQSAKTMSMSNSEWHAMKRFFDEVLKDLYKPSTAVMRRKGLTVDAWKRELLEKVQQDMTANPSLATCRFVSQVQPPTDGWTPLHVAAHVGCVEMVELIAEQPGVSVWCVDLQGRTPLAVAATEGHAETVFYLKGRMEEEQEGRGGVGSIMGQHAPLDLAGRTPVAWSVKGKRNPEVDQLLYAVGDSALCPEQRPESNGAEGVDALTHGFADAPGWRVEMEDTVCTQSPLDEMRPDTGIFGVFDGHGGKYVSHFVSDTLIPTLVARPAWKEAVYEQGSVALIGQALAEAFIDIDEQLKRERRMDVIRIGKDQSQKHFKAVDSSGSTGVVAVVTADKVVVAWVGDSRVALYTPRPRASASPGGAEAEAAEAAAAAAVGYSLGSSPESGSSSPRVDLEVREMTYDHTAKVPKELARVVAAGGGVKPRECDDGSIVHRILYHPDAVSQSVVPSRAFGDFYYKQRADLPVHLQVVTVDPEICYAERSTTSCQLLLLACDGVWDVMSCVEAGELIFACLGGTEEALQMATAADVVAACDTLKRMALSKGSTDNITAMLVLLPKIREGGEGGAGGHRVEGGDIRSGGGGEQGFGRRKLFDA